MSKFSNYLKDFLEGHDLKLESFADKTGVSFGLVGHYVNGRRSPSYKFLEKFFKAYNIKEAEQKKIIEMIELEKMPESLKRMKETTENINNTQLSVILKKLRESRGLSQADLSEQSNVSAGTIGDIETGRIKSTIKTINKLAAALNLTSDEKNELDSAFLGRNVARIQDPRISTLRKKERIDLEDLLSESKLAFNDQEISEEAKKKFLDSLMELYFDHKKSTK